MIKIRARRLFAVALAVGVLTGAARAQSYPDRLVRIIVPQSPGGPTDLLARATAQRLQAAFGQNVIAENRGGAGGAIAAKMVASADPDGHTLLLGNTSVLVHIPICSAAPATIPPRRSRRSRGCRHHTR